MHGAAPEVSTVKNVKDSLSASLPQPSEPNPGENLPASSKNLQATLTEPEGLEGPDADLSLEDERDSEDSPPVNVLNRPLSPLALVLIGVLAIVALFLSLGSQDSGYLELTPGPAPLVEVQGYPREGSAGEYYFTTVEVKEIDFISWIWHKVSGNSDALIPAASPGSGSKAASYAQMEQSKVLAAQVAAAYIDPSKQVSAEGVKILDITEGSPAAAAGVELGDVIVAVGSQAVEEESQLVEILQAGDAPQVTLKIIRSEEPLELVVNFEGQDRTLGVQIMTSLEPSALLPISTGDIGGSSGGLMFTLADIDALIGGDLSGGRKIAGTGTIGIDGTVGPVGGTNHKVKAAQDAGASIFFVPIKDAALAKSAAGGSITVVPVATLKEAVDYLCATGGLSPVCNL